jgi:gliding motility-associated-like protein
MKTLYLLLFINVFTTYISYGQCPDPKHPDYDALMGLYTSTNGANWINKTGWDGGAAGTNCDPCSGWYGIVCQNGRVTGINLPGNNLSGYISVLSYEELRDIYLQQNEIEGTLPEINSPKLQYIEFSSNNFVSINTFFGINAPLLAVYVLNDNELNDCISSSYNSLCAQGTQVFLDDNPGFNVNSWTNFCTDGTGGCTTTQGTCPDFVQIQNPEEICEGEDFSINITLIGGNPPFRLVLEDEYNPGVDIVVVENVNERNYTFEFNGSSGLPIPSLGAHNYRIGHRIIEPGLIQTCFIDENPVSQDMLVVNSLTATINTYPDNGTGNGGCEISFSPSLFDAYYFNWTGPEAGTIQSNTSPVTITNLPAGLYSLSITKGNGACETIYSFNIDLDNTSNPCNHPDYTNLMKIYNNTGGPNWKRNGTISDPNSISNGWDKDCDVCNWYGIRCNANNRVICIDLDGIDNCAWDFNSGNNNMTGTIPSLSFEEVEYFNLSNNGLFGSLSGLNLPKVKSLNITDSKLNGNLTDFDFNKPALEEIRLQYSQLSGSIPNFNLPNLKVLDLGGNKLSGELPALNTPNLEFISFGENKNISGVIPNYEFSKLHTLYLHDNILSGNFPNLNLPNLKILSFYNNNLSGCIPAANKQLCNTVTNGNISNNPLLSTQSWSDFCINGSGACNDTIVCSHPEYAELMKFYNSTGGTNWFKNGTNTDPSSLFSGWGLDCNFCNWFGVTCDNNGNVIKLELFSNNLSGTMSDLNPLTNLEILGLGGNNIEGEIPYFNLPNLKGLYLGGNKLKGNLSSYELPNIEVIIINENKLTGQLPNFSYPKLEALILSKNQLSGNIPELKMSKLEFLGLGINNFSGNLPDFSLPAIKNLSLNDNSLYGCIPISYKVFCSQNIEVNLLNNNDLINDDWSDFCNNNDGACCFLPLVSNYETVAKINEINTINIKQLGLIPDSSSYKIIDIRNGDLSSSGLVNQHEFSFSFTKHFFGKIEVDIEVCGSSCKLCDTTTIFISDDYLPNIHPTNVISPDGDGSNDVLRFNEDGEISDSELTIFNRWGDIIYRKKEYTNDWDASGYPGGVYFYVLKVKNVVLKNTLTIIK